LANSKVPDVNFYLGIICSLYVVTRKMCELYLCETKSGETLMEVYRAILTCKSFVKYEYRGEISIELSSSWFQPKFPPGKQEEQK